MNAVSIIGRVGGDPATRNLLVSCLINCVSSFGNLILDNAISFYAALAESCEPLTTESTNRV
jgi:hypothetical protein